ncbi:MAG: hypothetical protein Q8N69_00920 [bacterium]|nr:hypothetical protein [bacterium]
MNPLRVPGILLRRYQMKRRNEGPFSLEEILRASPLPTAALVDLGAFKKPLQRIPDGIDKIVLMEDRRPEFFLGFEEYEPEKIVPLNRQPIREKWTQAELAELVRQLHSQGKKVLIGFWGFWADGVSRKPTAWMAKHPELRPLKRGESDIGNPFATLQPEGITFAEYIALQYQKLYNAFHFNGTFLGDGLCGRRSLWHPELYCDQAYNAIIWSLFYATVAEKVHATGGQLWAYDCMGLSNREALLHGADYNLLAKAGLDVLGFQSYSAWSEYLKVPRKYGLYQDMVNMATVETNLSGTPTQLYYSLEMGDSVEGWHPLHRTTRRQMKILDPIADGRLLVWANELFANFTP